MKELPKNKEILIFKKKYEKRRTKIGEVKRPAPASAIGIIGRPAKYSNIAKVVKNVRRSTGHQRSGRSDSLFRNANKKTNITHPIC